MARLHVILCVVITCFLVYCSSGGQLFSKKYKTNYGTQQVSFLNGGTAVRIKLEEKSGGGGIRSKHAYVAGYFETSLKIPEHSQAIVSTYYLCSSPCDGNHDELDFEVLGSDGPSPKYILHTNIFTQDSGHRERQYKLWFDPTKDFHKYGIFWNSHLVVFYVDGNPVRVFKNMEKINRNYKYPKASMYSYASLWNGSGWAGNPNWNKAPFYANYAGLVFIGCTPKNCHWDGESKQDLSPGEWKTLKHTERNTMIYDYCKHSPNNSPECNYGW